MILCCLLRYRIRVFTKEEEARIQELKQKYSQTLEALHQYERTGKTMRLYIPHPHLSLAKNAFKTARFGLKVVHGAWKVVSWPFKTCERASQPSANQ